MHRLSNLPYRDRPRALRELAALAPHLPPAVQNRFDLLLRSGLRRLRHLGQAEISHVQPTFRIEHQIAGLDITVENALIVSVL